MDIRMHEPFKSHQFKKVLCFFQTFWGVKPLLSFSPKSTFPRTVSHGKSADKTSSAVWPGLVDWLAVGLDGATIRMVKSGNNVQQRRFAAAARPDQTDELSLCNAERHVVEGVDMQRTGLEPFRHMFKD